MIAILVDASVVLAGVTIPAHRTLEVVDELELDGREGKRSVVTAGEARALVRAGYAEAIEADFGQLSNLLERWQRA